MRYRSETEVRVGVKTRLKNIQKREGEVQRRVKKEDPK